MEFTIYLALSAIYAFIASRTVDRRVLGFVLLLWLLVQPVATLLYTIRIPGLPFVISPNRLLFIFALIYMASGFSPVPATRNQNYRRPYFEKYLYLYIALVLFALVINYDYILPKRVIGTPLEIVIFVTVYSMTKRHMTPRLLEVILKTVVFLGLFLSILVLFQLIVNQDFLRTGLPKYAFGNVYRAFGIFRFDGELGVFQAFALIVLFLRYPEGRRKNIFIALIFISILLTFLRLSYLIMFTCITVYAFYFARRRAGAGTKIVVLGLVPVIIVLLYISSELFGGGGVKAIDSRMMDKASVAGRLQQYHVILEQLIKTPLGMGAYENKKYLKLMQQYGMVQSFKDARGNHYVKPLGVHNGYLGVAVRYGVAGMAIFISLLVALFMYFKKLSGRESRQYVIPMFACLIWILGNLTQSAGDFRAYYILLVAIITGSFVSMHRTKMEIGYLK